ncbi:MAG: hypothetical protein PHQ09_03075 [Actinomycetota bacterium]|nr:hypothetical protein [Actinomycetota bacterium]
MTVKIKIRLAAVILLALLLIGTLGTGVAAAVTEYVGGGVWYWNYITHIWCCSEYFHSTLYHSATSICGSGYQKVYKYGGENAVTQASGWGTTYVYWNTY